MKLTSYGAAREVTGSNHILETDSGSKIVIDCGMFQGHRQESEQKNRVFEYDPTSIDTAILTHGHCDHCCRLPYLGVKGFTGNIYSTPAARDIAGLVMSDTAHIMAKDAEWLRKKKINTDYQPLFEEADVTQILNQFVTISYGRDFFINDGIKCTFYDAGHILGSAVVVMEFPDGRRIAFTGDLGRNDLPIIRDPEPIPDVDYLVAESTYGNRLHDPITDAKRELAEVVQSTVKKGGKVIIPAFAVERTQELIYFLHQLIVERKIPKVDIFVDSPMAFNATSIFRVHQECYDETVTEYFLDNNKNPFTFEGLKYITDVSESKRLNERTEPCIIISSSGMCEAGRILHHLKNNIEDDRNTILIVGYMAENTLGRKIAERQPEVKIFGATYALRARVKILNTFSAHADYQDICNYVSRLDLNRLKKVFLVHGETEALSSMQKHLLDAGVNEVQIVEHGTAYTI